MTDIDYDADPRPCENETCGKSMTRGGRAPALWRVTKYCDIRCAGQQNGRIRTREHVSQIDHTETKVCALESCDREFKREGRSKSHWTKMSYCGTNHANAARAKASTKKGGIPATATKPCTREGCDGVIVKGAKARSTFEAQKFCSRQCSLSAGRDAQAAIAAVGKVCGNCAGTMTIGEGEKVKNFNNRKHCSDRCRRAATSARLKANNAGKTTPARQKIVRRRTQRARLTPSGLERPVFPGPKPETIWRPAGFTPEVNPWVGKVAS